MSPRPPRRPRSTGPTPGERRADQESSEAGAGQAPQHPAEGQVRGAVPDAAAGREPSGRGGPDEEPGVATDDEAPDGGDAAPEPPREQARRPAREPYDETVVPLTRETPVVPGRRRTPRVSRTSETSSEDVAPETAEAPADARSGGAADDAAAADQSAGGAAGGDAAAGREADDLLAFPEPEVVVHRRRRRRGMLMVGAGLAALLVVVLVLVFSPLLTIRQVEVEGNDLLTDSRAKELLEPVLGRPMPQVGDGRVEELLGGEAVVADVVVQGALPDTLRVEVTEHPPVAQVRRDGQVEYYTAEGEVIRSWPEGEAPPADEYATPEISSDAALEHRAVFEAIAGVLGELPDAARKSMESASATSVDSVRLTLDDGRTVVWGGEDRGDQKARVLAALLESDAEEFTEVDTIDISDPAAPVTR